MIGTLCRLEALMRRFGSARSGSVATIFAISLVPLLLTASLALDYVTWTDQRTKLQATADAAATAAARVYQLPKADIEQLEAVAQAFVSTQYENETGQRQQPIEMTTAFDLKQQTAEVTLAQAANPSILKTLVGGTVKVTARAQAYNGGTICVIGLNPNALGTISLTNFARLTAVDCGVYSNSTNIAGILSLIDARLKTELTCSAGGTIGLLANFDPRPQSDCPQIEDPLKDRPAPDSMGCDYTKLKVAGGVKTLTPGVYCGGLSVSGKAHVSLSSGVYVIKDGPLSISDSAEFTGEHVGFYLEGALSTFTFGRQTTISLTAPRDGVLAGLLIFEARNAPLARTHRILSDNARTLLGTIYLPRGHLLIDAYKQIADQSAYTAIVARRLILQAGPELVLNADYNSTDIPVPEGIGPIKGRVVLVK